MMFASNLKRTNRPGHQPAGARRLGGFMLIEVLVSVLLFSVGVLAVVGLQASMSKAQTASKGRADAAYLANELIGLMWSDSANINSYNGAGCANYTRCQDWANKISTTLPKGAQTISVALAPGETNTYDVTIAITWALPDGGTHTYSTQTTIAY